MNRPPRYSTETLGVLVAAAFAVASLLALLSLVTLVAKSVVEWQVARQMAAVREEIKAPLSRVPQRHDRERAG